MDCRDVGALANAGKCPLGLAWSILTAKYGEETDAYRIWEVQRTEASLMEVDAWLLRNGTVSYTHLTLPTIYSV